jgi:hypothetical protein
LGTKSELEKTRIKINVITENKTTTYKEELKVSSIIFKNVVYYGNKKIQNGKIELMIKGLWDRFERPPSWETINIDPNQTYSQPICQLFKNRDYAEIILGEVDPEKYRSLPNILKKDHIYDVSVKFCKDEQEETIHCFKIDTSWENFGLKLAC